MPMTMMLAEGLTAREAEKFSAVGDPISLALASLGYVTRLCRASGQDDARMIEFVPQDSRRHPVAFQASRFLADPAESLLQEATRLADAG